MWLWYNVNKIGLPCSKNIFYKVTLAETPDNVMNQIQLCKAGQKNLYGFLHGKLAHLYINLSTNPKHI